MNKFFIALPSVFLMLGFGSLAHAYDPNHACEGIVIHSVACDLSFDGFDSRGFKPGEASFELNAYVVEQRQNPRPGAKLCQVAGRRTVSADLTPYYTCSGYDPTVPRGNACSALPLRARGAREQIRYDEQAQSFEVLGLEYQDVVGNPLPEFYKPFERIAGFPVVNISTVADATSDISFTDHGDLVRGKLTCHRDTAGQH